MKAQQHFIYHFGKVGTCSEKPGNLTVQSPFVFSMYILLLSIRQAQSIIRIILARIRVI